MCSSISLLRYAQQSHTRARVQTALLESTRVQYLSSLDVHTAVKLRTAVKTMSCLAAEGKNSFDKQSMRMAGSIPLPLSAGFLHLTITAHVKIC